MVANPFDALDLGLARSNAGFHIVEIRSKCINTCVRACGCVFKDAISPSMFFYFVRIRSGLDLHFLLSGCGDEEKSGMITE